MPIVSHETSIDEKPEGHKEGSDQQWKSAAPSIDEDQSKDGHENVDDILDRRGDEIIVSFEACHAEQISDVVHHEGN